MTLTTHPDRTVIQLDGGIKLVIEANDSLTIETRKEMWDVVEGHDGTLRVDGHVLKDLIRKSVSAPSSHIVVTVGDETRFVPKGITVLELLAKWNEFKPL